MRASAPASFYARTPTAKYSFLCQLVSREMNLHRLFWTQKLTSKPTIWSVSQMAPTSSTLWLLANYIWSVDGNELSIRHLCECAHVCLRTEERDNWGFKANSSLNRWTVYVFYSLWNTKQVSAGNWGHANETLPFHFLWFLCTKGAKLKLQLWILLCWSSAFWCKHLFMCGINRHGSFIFLQIGAE